MPPGPEYPGPWTVPCTAAGPVPKCSMTSISPQPGQPDWPMSWPSIQNAGQIPRARGIFIRAWDQPVPHRHPVPGNQPRGGVPAAAVPPAGQFRVDLPDHDGQVPRPVEGGVAELVGVILQLLVSPPGSAGLGPPGAPVRRGSPCAIELIRPCQMVRAAVNPVAHARASQP